MDYQRVQALYPGKCKGSTATLRCNLTFRHISRQTFFRRDGHYALTMSVNGASTIQTFHLGKSRVCVTLLISNQTVGPVTRQTCLEHDHNDVRKWTSAESQWSVNDLRWFIWNTLTATERRWPTTNWSSAFIGKNASDDIASASYYWALTELQ